MAMKAPSRRHRNRYQSDAADPDVAIAVRCRAPLRYMAMREHRGMGTRPRSTSMIGWFEHLFVCQAQRAKETCLNPFWRKFTDVAPMAPTADASRASLGAVGWGLCRSAIASAAQLTVHPSRGPREGRPGSN
jgi:hypothetical protein